MVQALENRSFGHVSGRWPQTLLGHVVGVKYTRGEARSQSGCHEEEDRSYSREFEEEKLSEHFAPVDDDLDPSCAAKMPCLVLWTVHRRNLDQDVGDTLLFKDAVLSSVCVSTVCMTSLLVWTTRWLSNSNTGTSRHDQAPSLFGNDGSITLSIRQGHWRRFRHGRTFAAMPIQTPMTN